MNGGDVITPVPQSRMQDKELLLGVDEFTLTILLKNKIYIEFWVDKANQIIQQFLQNSLVESVLDGKLEEMNSGKLNGYTDGYNLGEKDYYFAIAYNLNHPEMGVCVRFSAKAWAIYQARYYSLYKKQIILPDFLKMITFNIDERVRLTRIDLTADYYEYFINITDLYNSLKEKEIIIQNDQGKNVIREISFYGKNQEIETVYVGSKKENTNGFLRIYDKRIEQISKNGFRKLEALSCESWIRFEGVFKGKYAHAISETLISNDMDSIVFSKYIAQLLTQKYRFYECATKAYTDFTIDLLRMAEGCDYARLRSESPRDNSLAQNIAHIRHGSGLFPTLYKIKKLYGNNSDKEFMKYLFRFYQNEKWMSSEMEKELRLWLKKHADLKSVSLKDNY